ncbi:MAG TPA: hypothetical protein VER17_05395 [Tepidisphaeraceae bacterium]|nr:hypothetical protein [Tepidisphaeraceae bacterium]
MRKFLETKAGFVLAGVMLVVALGAIVVAFQSTFGETEAEGFTNTRDYIDAETGKPFKYTLKAGDSQPVDAPSGKKSGYPAERCYWTKDGKPKAEPTLVLLNLFKGNNDPTFCPDCGRLVVPHNPAPGPGAKPPPTKQEYKPSRNASQER